MEKYENYECLISFLDKLYNQGSMKFQTTRTRKTAIRKVFLKSSFDKENIMTLDLDQVIAEFIKREGGATNTNSATVNTYKSRIKRSIEDYIRIEKLGEKPKHDTVNDKLVLEEKVAIVDIQCAIRDGKFIVDIKNLPVDLKEDELKKIIDMIKLATK
jgi:anti-sigma28 factor (negative regulator of flagellin synthesis)